MHWIELSLFKLFPFSQISCKICSKHSTDQDDVSDYEWNELLNNWHIKCKALHNSQLPLLNLAHQWCRDEGIKNPFQYIGNQMHIVIAQATCEEIKWWTCKVPYQPPTPLRKFPDRIFSVGHNYNSLGKETSSK